MDLLWALITWTVFGAIVGGIARLLMPGDQNMGCLMTVILGVIGSYVGGFIASLFSGEIVFNQASGWIMSIIGAVVLLVIAGMVMKKSGPPKV